MTEWLIKRVSAGQTGSNKSFATKKKKDSERLRRRSTFRKKNLKKKKKPDYLYWYRLHDPL